MSIEQKTWTETTDDEWKAMGNTPTTVFGPVASLGRPGAEESGVVWEGLAAGWQETAAGALELRRRVTLNPGSDREYTMAFTFQMIAPGRWWSIETESYSFDLEAIIARETAEQEADEERRRQAEAQARLLAPGRAMRRAGG
ncbi:MAG: hypothetical protein KGH75_00385 [Rhodospirillales bacterium]|nr:hypothetical protein [Rhodospirillales bacterium]